MTGMPRRDCHFECSCAKVLETLSTQIVAKIKLTKRGNNSHCKIGSLECLAELINHKLWVPCCDMFVTDLILTFIKS